MVEKQNTLVFKHFFADYRCWLFLLMLARIFESSQNTEDVSCSLYFPHTIYEKEKEKRERKKREKDV